MKSLDNKGAILIIILKENFKENRESGEVKESGVEKGRGFQAS